MTTDNKSTSDKLENGDARGDSNTATSHGGGIIATNTPDSNRNSNDNLITIELTRDLKDQEIVSNFIFDRKSKHLILSLNHKYRKKTIVSPGQDHTKKCSASDSKKTVQNTHPENATPENTQVVHADKQLSAEIFRSRLVQSIREATANIEKISFFEWEDLKNQNCEDV